MKLLVTGASGFLGSHIVNHFAQQGGQVCGMVRKLDGLLPVQNVQWRALELPSNHLATILTEEMPDVIVHTAASAHVNASLIYPAQDFTQSVVVWNNLLESVRLIGLRPKIIFLSSAAVYGNPQQLPVAESAPIHPISPYGYHKHMCEEMAEYYVKLYGFNITSLRIFSAYGTGLFRQVLWDIVQKAQRNPVVEMNGVGDETRDFIHASDVARAVECVIRANPQPIDKNGSITVPVFNVGSGVSTTILEIVEMMMTALELEKPILFNGQRRNGDPLYWQADICKLSAIDFRPLISLPEGIRRYISWVLEQTHD